MIEGSLAQRPSKPKQTSAVPAHITADEDLGCGSHAISLAGGFDQVRFNLSPHLRGNID
jgi:hypothetical protein